MCDIEVLFNASFQRLFYKKIHLHKYIRDDDILLLHTHSRYVCIVDRTDIQFPGDRYLQLHNVPQTQYNDPLIRTSPYSIDTIVYPYTHFKDIEMMTNEPVIWISKTNKFLNNNFAKATLVLKLNKQNNEYYIEYWMNNKIINNMLSHKREPRGPLFTELVCSQAKMELLDKLDIQLQDVTAPCFATTGALDVPNINYQGILKDSVTLFNYQLSDLQWMRDIEDSISKGTNTITHTYPLSYPVFHNSFLLFNSMLYPINLINQSALVKTTTITYCGGSLISEIGLGKTIVSLCHILSHCTTSRALYNNFVFFGSNCNYAYKRGAMKETICKKKCINNGLYCGEHKKSIFIEKRELKYKNIDKFHPRDFTVDNLIKTNATLVVCPNQLCDQWIKEYYNKFVNDFRVLLVVTKDQYTNLKLSDILFADIIIVSYQFLTNEYYQKLNYKRETLDAPNEFCFGPDKTYKTANELLDSKDLNLFKFFQWRMIFLDEAHEIQNMAKSKTFRQSLNQLNSVSKWNVTGTPFANGLSSFVNLISYNSSFEGSCHSLEDIVSVGLNSNFIQVYKWLFRRNTKQSIKGEYNGTLISEKMHELEFTQQERSLYDSYIAGGKSKYIDFLIKICCHSELYEDTKDLIKNCKTLEEIQEVILDYNKTQLKYFSSTLKTINRNITILQTQITNMGEINPLNVIEVERLNNLKSQLATTRRKHTTTTTQYATISRTYNYLVTAICSIDNTEETCPICLDTIDNDEKAITKCGHKFCWDCINQTHEMKANLQTRTFTCPTCNSPITNKDIFIYRQPTNNETHKHSKLVEIVQHVKSTKIGNIIYYLKNNVVKGDKIILFSQWDELLHKVGNILQEQKLKIVYCNGTVFQRKKAIQSFMDPSNDINIILLSSRNAASGINLTAANKIILLEPVYGSGEYRSNIESQAIGRADRIGQKRPIEVHRFIIKNTIEEDIINGNIDDNEIRQLRM